MGRLTQIIIVSNNELNREGLKRLLVSDGLPASCLSFDEARAMSTSLDIPDHLLLIEGGDQADILPMAELLHGRFAHARIALLCNDFTLDFLKKALGSGIHGFLTRDIAFSALLHCLRLILAGEKVLPTRCIDHLIGADAPSTPINWKAACDHQHLSQREVGILHCLIDGDANKVISRRLNIAEPTVKVHIKAILRKLKVLNRTQAAVWAVSRRSPGAVLQ